jgi:hypothetical protein
MEIDKLTHEQLVALLTHIQTIVEQHSQLELGSDEATDRDLQKYDRIEDAILHPDWSEMGL